MIVLSVDVGNSVVSSAVFRGGVALWVSYVSVFVLKKLNQGWWGGRIFGSLPCYDFSFAVFSSVVPSLSEGIFFALLERVAIVYQFGCSHYPLLPIAIRVPHPGRIGTDLVANACYAWMVVKGACAVVDFGTALTITVVDKEGALCGVTITPGVSLAIKVLASETEQLMEVPIEMPSVVIGCGTVHAIQSGVVYGYEFLVKGLLSEIERELGTKIQVFLTGGFGYLFKERFFSFPVVYNRYLTLEGLYEIGRIIHQQNF